MQEIISAKQVFEHFRLRFNPDQEEVWILGLNPQLQMQFDEMLFRGTLTHCPIHPRDIFRVLLKHNAYAFILGHNHPSGGLEPSVEDTAVTQKLLKLSKMMQLPMIDHIIYTNDNYYSFLQAKKLFLSRRRS